MPIYFWEEEIPSVKELPEIIKMDMIKDKYINEFFS